MRPRVALTAVVVLFWLDGRMALAGVQISAREWSHAAEDSFHKGLGAAADPAKARPEFSNAALIYELVARKKNGDSADLAFNQGNAHMLADELPQAILAYRRGLRMYPLSAALWENLELARDQVGYPDAAARHRPPGDRWPPWLPRPTPDTLLNSVIVLHGLAWLANFAWLVLRRRWVGWLTVGFFVTALAATGWWSYMQWRITQDEERPLAVVAVNGVTLRRGNGSMYPRHPDLPRVNRGMEARLLHNRGGWVQLQFPGGEIGWLPRQAVVTE